MIYIGQTCFIKDNLFQGWQTYDTNALARGIHCCTNSLYFFRPTNVPILWRTGVYIHISDCVQTVYELPLLQNNTAVKLCTQIGAVRSVDWIFIVGGPAWRSLGQCVTSDRTFYSLLMKQEAVSIPVSSKSVDNYSTSPQKLSPALICCYINYKCM